MDIITKILIIQAIVLVLGHLSMFPSSVIANFVAKKFGDYGKGLEWINGIQIVLILITFIIWLFSRP